MPGEQEVPGSNSERKFRKFRMERKFPQFPNHRPGFTRPDQEVGELQMTSLLRTPPVQQQAQDSLEKKNKSKHEDLKPVDTETAKLAKDVSTACRLSSNLNARELAALLSKPHVKGLTVELDEENNLIVARILAGGAIERQGLLKPGDVIIEVNGVAVNSPEDLQAEVVAAKDTVTFRVAPSSENVKNTKPQQTFMKALFNYDPHEDTLLPCKEIGLPFKQGDILQIVDTKDPNWWQAKKVGQEGVTGLIPSQELEERRKAFVAPEADYVHKISVCGTRISKKKRKFIYKSKSNHEFDKAELLLYEEVALMPPFNRRTLALVGSYGVGRRTLKNRLINSDPNKYGSVIPMTSRPMRELEENGQNYWFVSREHFENEIADHQMFEYGEHNGHLYGTSLESIRDVIRQGKMCILDCSPAALKLLYNSSEFMPYVIFIAAPGMELLKQLYDFGRSTGVSTRTLTFDRQSSIRHSSRRARTLESLASLYEEDDLKRTVEESAMLQRSFEKYIDMVIVNEDFDVTFRKVVDAMSNLGSKHQWVPANWVYS
ncbi:unnamed protein product [Nesidiocoris tenuis]|uniref:MAGUK p55 subfamily member 6 n=1 Tax=Nesidiocoris tenuis TaxID=355587 RepID=A0A6H5GN36_9HEMI|nr:unnamed protein product [Nesidiocoris tenuis]